MFTLKSSLNWKSWAVAFVLATGAFWLTMVKDPPKSDASDPSVGSSLSDIKIPSTLPFAEGDNAH